MWQSIGLKSRFVEELGMKKRIIRVSLLQFFIFLSMGFVFPFYSLYYRNILSVDGKANYYIIGLILFLSSIVGILSPPVAGILSDKFKIRNRLVTIFALLSGLGSLLLVIPGMKFFKVSGVASPYTLKLVFVMSGAILLGFATKPIIPLLDTETLSVLELKYGNTNRYGNIRLFGSMGWILSASLAGIVIKLSNSMFILFVIAVFIFVVIAIMGVSGVKEEVKRVQIPLKLLFKDKKVLVLFFYVFVLSIGMNGSFMFTSVYMNNMQVDIVIIGLALGLAAIPELFVLLNTQRLIPKWGYKKMIVIGGLVQVIKLVSFALLGKNAVPMVFILIQGLHGVSFPLQYAAWVSFLNDRAHKDLKATYQNFNQLVFTAGSATGGFLASLAVGLLGTSWMMALAALVVLVSLGIYLLGDFVFPN